MELSEYISRIREISRLKKMLDLEESILSSPTIEDVGKIDEVFGYCREGYMELHPGSGMERRTISRQFLFIILYFFSPKALSGGKMRVGIRDNLARLLETTAENVSHYSSDLMFLYETYEDFSSDVNELFSYVVKRLKSK